jgi:polyisoprenoid-binding protein YceI
MFGATGYQEGLRMSKWQIDPYHTQIEFSAKHLGMMTVRGLFTEFTSTANLDSDHPEDASVEVVIQMSSIQTHHPQRDADLRSSKFLEVDKYPTATFTTTGFTPKGTDAVDVTGDLTIKGVTKSVVIPLTRLGEFDNPAMGHRIGYSGAVTINRRDFGVTFNAVLDGKFVVSDEIRISVEGELLEVTEDASLQAA